MEKLSLSDQMSRSVALRELEGYHPTYPEEIIFLEKMKNFLNENEIFAHRSNLTGHFTGSAWIINPAATHVLLIRHVKLDKWIQPGGHTEFGDENFLATSLREASEETGINIKEFILRVPDIFDIDIHTIPEKTKDEKIEPEHPHYDIRYLFTLDNTDTSQIDTNEVSAAKWVPIDELVNAPNTSQAIRRMAKKTQNFRLTNDINSSVNGLL